MIVTTHYRETDYTVMPWKNGGGSTIELAREPEGGSYRWRLSVADVVGDGPFSAFAGLQRVITVLEGAGMRLTVDGRPSADLHPYEGFAFDGSSRTDCELLAGPVRDFNLIYRPESVSARLEWLTLPGSRTFLTGAATVLVYSCGTGVVVRTSSGPETVLARHELLRLDNTGGPVTVSIDAAGGGHSAVIELSKRCSPAIAGGAGWEAPCSMASGVVSRKRPPGNGD